MLEPRYDAMKLILSFDPCYLQAQRYETDGSDEQKKSCVVSARFVRSAQLSLAFCAAVARSVWKLFKFIRTA